MLALLTNQYQANFSHNIEEGSEELMEIGYPTAKNYKFPWERQCGPEQKAGPPCNRREDPVRW